MKLFLLALRNLSRNLRRTVITVSAIAFGMIAIHYTITLQTGQYREMITKGVSTLAGHVVVQARGYQEERDADLMVTEASAVQATLQELFPDADIAPRIFLGGLLNSATNSVGVALSGVDPVAESHVQTIDDQITAGEWLDDDLRGIVIGVDMAESLGVEVGDKVVYMGQHGDSSEMASRLFRIKGLFRTGGAELDGFVAMTSIAAARELLDNADVAHQVTVHLEDPDQSADAAATATERLSTHENIDVLHWSKAIPEIYGLIQIDRSSGDVALTILGVIVAMGVLNTVLMSVLERTREFGVMMALGMKPAQLSRLILLEGLSLGLIGSALGALLGGAVSWSLVEYGLDMQAMTGMETMESAGIVLSGKMYGAFNPGRMATYTLGAVGLTTLAALYPSLYVSWLTPVDAMRHHS